MHDSSDLQATQSIIELFENSKDQCETELENLPGIYGVIHPDGSILKGNLELASVFGLDSEYLLGRNLSEIIIEKEWPSFLASLENASSNFASTHQLQVGVKSPKGGSLSFLWNFARIQNDDPQFPTLITVIGRDVTALNSATEQNTRMKMEFETARTIQSTLFPEPLYNFGKSKIAGYYESASECGGDWWFYSESKDGKLFLWIGDVTGHGVPSALVTSAARSAVSIISGNLQSPAEALKQLNRAVLATAKGTRMMTFLVASVDLESGEVIYSSAAHESMLIIPGNKPIETVKDITSAPNKPSTPLGFEPDAEFQESRVQLSPGDRLFLYTDGVYDITDPSGTQWSRTIFRKNLARLAASTTDAQGLVGALTEEIRTVRQGVALPDDVTYCCFQF